MLVLINAKKEVSMADFRQELEGLMSTSSGAISISMQRMQENGLVAVAKTAPMPVRAGKARNVYSITEKGRAALLEAEKVQKALDVLRNRRPSLPQPRNPARTNVPKP